MKLTPQQINLIALYQRTPHDEDGWARVSANLWFLTEELPNDLFERQGSDSSGGRMRATENGKIVIKYLH